MCASDKSGALNLNNANPKMYYYSFIYKSVNSRTEVTKYYTYAYETSLKTNGTYLNWTPVFDTPTGYYITDVNGNKIS